MADNLPRHFTNLYNVFNERATGFVFVNVIGIATEVLETVLSRGGDYTVTFALIDPVFKSYFPNGNGVDVRFFKPKKEDLPSVSIGDVVLLRSIKIQPRLGKNVLLCNRATQWLVLPPSCVPEHGFKIAYAGDKDLEGVRSNPFQKLSVQERMYLIDFYHENKALAPPNLPNRTVGSSRILNGVANNGTANRVIVPPADERLDDHIPAQVPPETTCQQCSKRFPTNRIRDVHHQEHHSQDIARARERGQRSLGCFVSNCTRKFKAPPDRQEHLQMAHQFPLDYAFSVVDTGMEEGVSYMTHALKDDFPEQEVLKDPVRQPVKEQPVQAPKKTFVPTGPSAVSLFGNKFGIIHNVAPGNFYDVLVEVVRMYPGQYDAAELYVTDYTTNKCLFDYASPEEERNQGRDGDDYNYTDPHRDRQRKWPGPYGQMALRVEVKDPHASYARSKVSEGDLVVIRNMRIKTDPAGRLEGNLWPDSRYPEKISLQACPTKDCKEVIELLERKEKYWKGKKRSLSDNEDAKKEKAKAKKRRQKERDREQKAIVAKPKESKNPANPHVICGNQDVNLSTISSLLSVPRVSRGPSGEEISIPFINQKRRVLVRVVDFYPPRLEDFARPYNSTLDSRRDSDSEADTGADAMDLDVDSSLGYAWQWDFFLLVEDGSTVVKQSESPRLWLHVSNSGAQFLLNDEATDISNDLSKVQALRNKLWVLWGDLEEKKRKAQGRGLSSSLPSEDVRQELLADLSPDNVPFECCIREYGQEVDAEDLGDEMPMGWIRIHEMFETTIK